MRIAYSPWSRIAEETLRRQGIAFRTEPYTPTLSEPRLRWRLGKFRGPLSVPVFLPDEGPAVTDSWSIAQWASDRSDTPMALPGDRGEIASWDSKAQAALAAGRRLTSAAVLANPDALRASLPGPIRALGPLGRAIGRDATRRVLHKYGVGAEDTERATLKRFVSELDVVIRRRETLLKRPSHADIVAAFGLSFIDPDARAPIPDVARPCWTQPEIRDAYPAVFEWRDRVLAQRNPLLA